MEIIESIADMIDWTPELFLGICLISATILFCVGNLGWTDYKGLPKYKNPPPPPPRKSFKERLAEKREQKFIDALKLSYPEFQKIIDYMDYGQYQRERDCYME